MQSNRPPLVFVCNGQGSHWLGMGKQLIANSASFYNCMKELQDETNVPLVDLYQDGHRWLDKQYSALGISTFQLGLLRLLKEEWKIGTPDIILGHSLGEVTCAHLAGFLTPAQVVRAAQVRATLVEVIDPNFRLDVFHQPPPIGHHWEVSTRCRRKQDYEALYDFVLKESNLDPHTLYIGRHALDAPLCRTSQNHLLKSFSMHGQMAVIGVAADELQSTICNLELDETVIGCYNSPTAQTVSGPRVQIQALLRYLRSQHPHVFVRELDTDGVAYHAPFLQLFRQYLQREFCTALQLDNTLDVDNEDILLPADFWKSTSDQTHWHGADYLVDNILRSVFFQQAIQELPQGSTVVEIGPAAGLLSQIKRTRSDFGALIPLVQHQARVPAMETLQQAAQQLDIYRYRG